VVNKSEIREFLVITVLISFVVVNAFWLIPEFVAAEGTSVQYPRLLNWLFGILTAGYSLDFYLTQARAGKKGTTAEAPAVSGDETTSADGKNPGLSLSHSIKVGLILVSLFIWVFLMEKIGFFLATFLFLFGSSLLYGESNIRKVLLFSFVFPLVIVVIFFLLNASLPSGIVEETLRGLVK
jgi:hypothetical protein